MKIAFFLLCLVSVVAARRSTRVHGGWYITQEVKEKTFPFLVSILACKGWSCGRCTGTLMARDKVLTAAHCVCDKEYTKVYYNSVTMGRGPMVKGKRVKIHKNYKCGDKVFSNMRYDVAVITLSKELTNNRPVDLECRREWIGEPVYMVGYGKDQRGHIGTLKAADQIAVTCKSVGVGVMCTEFNKDKPNHIDGGDSGGPLMVKKNKTTFVQIGITVYDGASPSNDGSYMVYFQAYARVENYCKRKCSVTLP